MENNRTTETTAKAKSNTPLILIGAVFLAALLGGWWFYNNSKTTTGANNNNTSANAIPAKNWNEVFSKAPQGASPAWSKGAPNAAVTIEEFADFQCPTCAQMHPKVQELQAAFGNRIRIIFRQFPLEGHQWSYDAACATEAAGMQGKFWEMQNLIFTNQQSWSNSPDARKVFAEYAQKIGLDVQKFNDDMIGMAVKTRVDADLQRGRAVSVRSTPAFYINNQPLGGNLNSLRQLVEAELQKAEAK